MSDQSQIELATTKLKAVAISLAMEKKDYATMEDNTIEALLAVSTLLGSLRQAQVPEWRRL